MYIKLLCIIVFGGLAFFCQAMILVPISGYGSATLACVPRTTQDHAQINFLFDRGVTLQQIPIYNQEIGNNEIGYILLNSNDCPPLPTISSRSRAQPPANYRALTAGSFSSMPMPHNTFPNFGQGHTNPALSLSLARIASATQPILHTFQTPAATPRGNPNSNTICLSAATSRCYWANCKYRHLSHRQIEHYQNERRMPNKKENQCLICRNTSQPDHNESKCPYFHIPSD